MATHDKYATVSDLRQLWAAVPCERLYNIEEMAQGYDVIGIDEGQFVLDMIDVQFPDIVQFSEKMASRGKIVIVAALDGTFERKAFGPILELVPLAESVTKLTAVCMGKSVGARRREDQRGLI